MEEDANEDWHTKNRVTVEVSEDVLTGNCNTECELELPQLLIAVEFSRCLNRAEVSQRIRMVGIAS